MKKTNAIFEFVAAAGQATRFEIFVNFGNVRHALHRMVKRRELKCWDGVYTPGQPYTAATCVSWTDRDIGVLTAFYEDGADAVQKRLTNRSIDSIHKMASRMGLKLCKPPVRKADRMGRLLLSTRVPAFKRGNIGPLVYGAAA